MAYSEKVIDHYENPRNVGTLDKDDPSVGTGLVGAPACGDVMRLQIRVSDEGIIEDAKFKTFGCGSAIASSSLATEWLKGKTVEEAGGIKNTLIVEEAARGSPTSSSSRTIRRASATGSSSSTGSASSSIRRASSTWRARFSTGNRRSCTRASSFVTLKRRQAAGAGTRSASSHAA